MPQGTQILPGSGTGAGCAGSGVGEPKDLQAQALAEAVDDAEKEGGGHKADQDDAQAVVLDEQEVDAKGQGAEVEEAEHTQDEARDGLPPPGAPLLPRAVAGQRTQAAGAVQPHHLQPAQALRWGHVLWHLQDGDNQTVGAGCGFQHTGAKEYLRRSGWAPFLGTFTACQQCQCLTIILQLLHVPTWHWAVLAAEGATELGG